MSVTLQNVTRTVDGVPTIRDVSLTLERGTLSVLLGPTLSGKTSIMRLLAGLDKPTTGRVLVDGKDVTGADVRQRSVAMVYQQFINYPSLTVYENIASPLRVQGKPKAEIYTSVGLQKQGKNLLYRDLLHHLSHSSDRFIIAPGIKGLVMLVFTLPSFPYVFKIIKDHFPPPKETTRAQIMEKYQLVKRHDRLGRMADTLEY